MSDGGGLGLENSSGCGMGWPLPGRLGKANEWYLYSWGTAASKIQQQHHREINYSSNHPGANCSLKIRTCQRPLRLNCFVFVWFASTEHDANQMPETTLNKFLLFIGLISFFSVIKRHSSMSLQCRFNSNDRRASDSERPPLMRQECISNYAPAD